MAKRRLFIRNNNTGQSINTYQDGGGGWKADLQKDTPYYVYWGTGYDPYDNFDSYVTWRAMDGPIISGPSGSDLKNRGQVIILPSDSDPDLNYDLSWIVHNNPLSVDLWTNMKNVIETNRLNGIKVNYDTVTNFNDVVYTDGFKKPILLLNGDVVLHTGASFFKINTTDNTIVEFASSSAGFYETAILLHTGHILVTRYDTVTDSTSPITHFDIVNPIDLTVETVYSTDIIYEIANYLGDNRVLMSAVASTKYAFSIFDPISYTLTPTVMTVRGSSYTRLNTIYLPDGKILSLPYGDGVARPAYTWLLNPYDQSSVDKWSRAIGTATTHPFTSGVVLTNGWCLAAGSDYDFLLINPIDLVKYNFAASNIGMGTSACTDGLLLHDGRVLFLSYGESASPAVYGYGSGIFDTDNYSYTSLASIIDSMAGGYQGGGKYGILLPDGRILLVPMHPYNEMHHIAFLSASDNNYGTLPSIETLCSAYLNLNLNY